MLTAGMLVMAAEPAHALAASNGETPAHQAGPTVLALGGGYEGGPGAVRVHALQRRLDGAGYSPGPIDGRYGPRTEAAVEEFQSARGLLVDGIAGPVTLNALHTTALYPGAGYPGTPSAEVRGLQRQLRREGYSPGPIDGRYGPLTERAVRRFQAAHGLRLDGIAGRQTLGELKRLAGPHRTAPRSSGRSPRPTRSSGPPRARHPMPSPSVAPQSARPSTRAPGHAGRSTGSSSAPWPVVLAIAGLLGLVALISGRWLLDRRRRSLVIAARPADPARAPELVPVGVEEPANPEHATALGARLEGGGHADAAELAYRYADERGDAAAASNVGVILERRGDRKGAEAAYRRADARGSADGAFNLAGLLLAHGDVEGAMDAYRRAEERGDAAAAANLALLLLEQRGDVTGAEELYRRADQRGDAGSAVNLGVLCERRGDLAGAAAAYRRADARGSADGAFNLGALLEERGDLANAAAAYHRAYERGDVIAALKVGTLLERQGDHRDALAAYQRAQESDQPKIAELARSRADALTLEMGVAGKGARP